MTHRRGKLPLSPRGQIQDVLIHSESIVPVCFSAVVITHRSIGGQLGWRRGGGGGPRKRMVGQSRGGEGSVDQVDSDGGCFDVGSLTHVTHWTVCCPCFAAFLLRGSLLLYRKDNRLIMFIIDSPMRREE